MSPTKQPTDLDKLQGTWRVTALQSAGTAMPPEIFAEASITLRGKSFTSAGMGDPYVGTIEIQPGKKPKALDLVFTVGPPRGSRNLGIYKLSGDTWTICLATRGDDRPTSFATPAETGWVLETLQRDTDGETAAEPVATPSRSSPRPAPARVAAAPSGPPTEIEGEWTMVSAVFGGQRMTANTMKWCKRVTRGNITRIVAGPQTMLDATFVLDTARRPFRIDYMHRSGANARKGQAGIYEMRGKTLRICMAAPGAARPADFSSKKGDGRSYTVWRLSGP